MSDKHGFWLAVAVVLVLGAALVAISYGIFLWVQHFAGKF